MVWEVRPSATEHLQYGLSLSGILLTSRADVPVLFIPGGLSVPEQDQRVRLACALGHGRAVGVHGTRQ